MAIYLRRTSPCEAAHPVLRWDLAWSLFLPQHVGDIPEGIYPRGVIGDLTNWAWNEFSKIGGRLRPGRDPVIWCVVPPLTPAGEDYVVRLASFWDDDVYWASEDGASKGSNLWRLPLVSIDDRGPMGALNERLVAKEDGATTQFFYPQLGLGRLHAMLETMEPGQASARLHSHSAVDEYYLVVSGKATLRMGSHTFIVEKGHFIGKPTGPDLTSQILADQGEAVTILDIEVWPDHRFRDKDVVHYPDFGELIMRGSGWRALFPDETLDDGQDLLEYYERGYRRHRDGTWTPADLPGAPARQKD